MTNKSYPNGRQLSAHPRYGTALGIALVLAALSFAFGSPADSTQPASTQFEGSFDKLEFPRSFIHHLSPSDARFAPRIKRYAELERPTI